MSVGAPARPDTREAPQSADGAGAEVPLVVDLDGTLVRSDLLVESVLLLLRHSLVYIFYLPLWLLRGKAVLKHEVARRVDIDPATLPYHEPLLEHLQHAARSGRVIILATAADRQLAERVAAYLGLFSELYASDGETNLTGEHKRRVLRERFGVGGFDYVANSQADLPVWSQARRAVLVGNTARVGAAAARVTTVERSFPRPAVGWRTYARALRVHQWLKNLLVFAPLIAAHRITDWVALGTVSMAFVAFCLCASSVYLLNDLLDLPDDRAHPRKRERPLASGTLSLHQGLVLIPVLLVTALLLAVTLLPWAFVAALAGYYALTLGYSLALKRLAILDVLALAMLYTLRMIAGGAAAGIALSFWLLAFSVFVFLSLAIAKRCEELGVMQGLSQTQAAGRGYRTSDLPVLFGLGGASGYVAVLVLALYVNSAQVVMNYSHPQVIWALCPVFLYWISRLWLKVARGEMHDDPVIFAVRDNGSRLTALVGVVLVWFAV